MDQGACVIARGTVVLVELDPTVGHEQRRVRPSVVVSDPAVNADQRFPVIAVVPVTGTAGAGASLSCPAAWAERPRKSILRAGRSSAVG